MSIRPPFKVRGGKWYLKKWIIDNFPKDYESMAYCEPFCGAATILLNKNKSVEEVISDIDNGIICILKSIRDEPKEIKYRLNKIKYCENTFKRAKREISKKKDYIDRAICELIIRKMSQGGLGKTFLPSTSSSPSLSSIIKSIDKLSEKLQNVFILNKHYNEIIHAWDDDNTFFYLDPPELKEQKTKHKSSNKYEMTCQEHECLLNTINKCKSKVMISGQSSTLYNKYLKNWNKKKKVKPGQSSKTEWIWMNY